MVCYRYTLNIKLIPVADDYNDENQIELNHTQKINLVCGITLIH